jgi:hypothetical protein
LQNWPNPFNPTTQLGYSLGATRQVELSVYNVQGQRVCLLDQGYRQAGVHTVPWDGHDQTGRPVGAGVYLYRLRAGDQTLVGKMVLLDDAAGCCSRTQAVAGQGQPKAGATRQLPPALFTLEVTGPGVQAFRVEHLTFTDRQVYNISVIPVAPDPPDPPVRFVAIDIDDVFQPIGTVKMSEPDVLALVELSAAIRRDFSSQFRFSLGYNSAFYDSTHPGDRAFIAHADQFIWFNHLPRHEHVVGKSLSSSALDLLFWAGLQFEAQHGLTAFRTSYMVTPLHEGIWPTYDPLYDTFERFGVTSTSAPTVTGPAAYGSVVVGQRTNLGLRSYEFLVTQVSDEELTQFALIFYAHQANFAHGRIGNTLISRLLKLLTTQSDFSVEFVPAAEAVARQAASVRP